MMQIDSKVQSHADLHHLFHSRNVNSHIIFGSFPETG